MENYGKNGNFNANNSMSYGNPSTISNKGQFGSYVSYNPPPGFNAPEQNLYQGGSAMSQSGSSVDPTLLAIQQSVDKRFDVNQQSLNEIKTHMNMMETQFAQMAKLMSNLVPQSPLLSQGQEP